VTRPQFETLRRLLWRFADVGRLAGRSYYDIIGVASSASVIEISAACEALRRAFNPERPPLGVRDAGERVAGVVRLIAEIEECLTNPVTRAQYDEERGP
jgi:DnaJ-class molecular chaperone